MRLLTASLLAATLVGCTKSPDSAGIEMPHDTTVFGLAHWASRLPDSLVHRAGACPFECCVYGTWTGTGDLPVRAVARRTEPVVDTIPAGEAFMADSGFVRLTGISVLVVQDTVNAGPTTFRPGDTIAVLDYKGEGYYNVWDGKQVWQVEDFWGGSKPMPDEGLVGDGRDGREWWVHATRKDGSKGWLDADSVPKMNGADACAGKAPR